MPSLATPGVGVVDGTIMLHRENNTGAMFLFNPTMREINISLPLSGTSSASLGFACVAAGSSSAATAPVIVEQFASSERTITTSAFAIDVLDCAGMFNATLPATSALVFAFSQFNAPAMTKPLLVGSPSSKVELDAGTGVLTILGAEGESGTPAKLVVALPHGTPKITKVVLNKQPMPTFSTEQFLGGLSAIVVRGTWAGLRFSRAQEIVRQSSNADLGLGSVAGWKGGGTGGTTAWKGSFNAPHSVLDQLNARNASYPIVYNTNPLDSDDANVPWLAPGACLQ